MKKAVILTFLLFQLYQCYRYPAPLNQRALNYYVYKRVVFENENPTTMTTSTTQKTTVNAEVLMYQKAFDEVINKIRRAIDKSHPTDLDDILQDLETSRLVR